MSLLETGTGSGDDLMAGMGMQTPLPPGTFQDKSALLHSAVCEDSLAPLFSIVSDDLDSLSLLHALTAPTNKLPSYLQEPGLSLSPVLLPLSNG